MTDVSAFILAHQGAVAAAAILITCWGFAAWVLDARRSERAREIRPVIPRQPPSPESAGFAAYLRGTRSPTP